MSETKTPREALGEVLAEHRQEHQPDTGGSVCACGQWTGPFTMHVGARAYAAHIATACLAYLAERLGSAEMREAVAGAIARDARLAFELAYPDRDAQQAGAALAAVAEVLGCPSGAHNRPLSDEQGEVDPECGPGGDNS